MYRTQMLGKRKSLNDDLFRACFLLLSRVWLAGQTRMALPLNTADWNKVKVKTDVD